MYRGLPQNRAEAVGFFERIQQKLIRQSIVSDHPCGCIFLASTWKSGSPFVGSPTVPTRQCTTRRPGGEITAKCTTPPSARHQRDDEVEVWFLPETIYHQTICFFVLFFLPFGRLWSGSTDTRSEQTRSSMPLLFHAILYKHPDTTFPCMYRSRARAPEEDLFLSIFPTRAAPIKISVPERERRSIDLAFTAVAPPMPTAREL